jgi:hypothetical protein
MVTPEGWFLAVETKTPGGRLSPEQRQFITEVRGLGGFAVCVRSWKELDAALRSAGYAAEDMPLFESPDTKARGMEEKRL